MVRGGGGPPVAQMFLLYGPMVFNWPNSLGKKNYDPRKMSSGECCPNPDGGIFFRSLTVTRTPSKPRALRNKTKLRASRLQTGRRDVRRTGSP